MEKSNLSAGFAKNSPPSAIVNILTRNRDKFHLTRQGRIVKGFRCLHQMLNAKFSRNPDCVSVRLLHGSTSGRIAPWLSESPDYPQRQMLKYLVRAYRNFSEKVRVFRV